MDSVLSLTRGNPLGPFGAVANLNPGQGTYTAICAGHECGCPPLFGQLRHNHGSRCARLSFLAPVDALNAISLPALIEHLTVQAGAWGAVHFLAEADANSTAFEGLRRAGFQVVAWQRIGKFRGTERLGEFSGGFEWQVAADSDTISIRALYQSLVPALVQPTEGLAERRINGLLHRRGSELLAYAELFYGPRGVYVQPYVHPASENLRGLLADLVCGIPRRAGRPIYLCIRSYQGWLEAALEGLNIEMGPRQAVMVKHLAVAQRVVQPDWAARAIEAHQVEPTTPITSFHD